MVEYRKRVDSDIWHWCENCSNWPTGDREARHTKPTSGKLCDECQRKDPESTIAENKHKPH